ncbi:membrane protein insertase YidC [Notoacmeibacter sp. MSK16QG-6]|uniref:membrane protein insertase YidC n=1 Tax=Notoacmeibacter sp. MSK16QG-6 TaxID=2957982 RepID=UPI00209D2BED|nr:membrane protein insertase YidC [Notoacmeibacter sp. MSK16QG-6]MCP1198714.1 membrane protein insertase YidC [Notoacmeibacter sp. MSK16QG-6]
MENQRNFLITIVLSVVILAGWQYFYMGPKIEAERARVEAQQESASGTPAAQNGAQGNLPAASGTAAAPGSGQAPGVTQQTREQAVSGGGRVPIETPALAGSINLTGARLDDLRLKNYRVSVEKDSPAVELLNPASLEKGWFAELGFIGGNNVGALPSGTTEWELAEGTTLTASTPVVLTHTNDAGLTFRRTIAVDDAYMFTVTDEISNESGEAVALQPYGRTTRFNKPQGQSVYVLHEGLIGVTGEDGLREVDYGDLEDDGNVTPGRSSDGWLGITDKYWAVALIPDTKAGSFQPRYAYFSNGRPSYQADYLSDAVSVPAGGKTQVQNRIFAGAKVSQQIDSYEDDLNIRQFDLLIDWGWFYFITRPMFWLIDSLFNLFGNFGLAILGATVVVKLIFFPLANMSYASMARMKKLQPKMTELREKYQDDKMKQQQAMMELYKQEKVNPAAGCLPMLLQIPVFFSLYKVLYVTIEMRHAPFFGWIQDLSAPDPTSLFNLFGVLPYDVPTFLMIGIWPLIMGVTMFLQMQMNPTPPDPTQAMIFKWMPIVFTFMMAGFPAGLVIYWAWNNTLSILQQGAIMKRQGAKIELWDNLKGLFSRKKTEHPAE